MEQKFSNNSLDLETKIGLINHQPDFFVYLCTVNECITKKMARKMKKVSISVKNDGSEVSYI